MIRRLVALALAVCAMAVRAADGAPRECIAADPAPARLAPRGQGALISGPKEKAIRLGSPWKAQGLC